MNTGYDVTAMTAVPDLGPALPTGVVSWGDAGGIAVWFVFAALVGTLLGILRERTSPHGPSEVAHTHHHHAVDRHLPHAA
jgi:hypothetical protein